MGVMMQAFYWDCPQQENLVGTWWDHVRAQVPRLCGAGITALWLPPVHKAGNVEGMSMGYDPYDYFDLGEFNQKGGVSTLFGTRDQLEALIKSIHGNAMQVYADMVINHNNGADATELSDVDNVARWTEFKPLSGKFHRNKEHFHPSLYERWDNEVFAGMPDLCHRHPYVYENLMKLVQWLVQDIGFDGFRFDFVKGYGSWVVKSIMEYRYQRNGKCIEPYGVAECWDNIRVISDWLKDVNAWSDSPVDAFDFPLRWQLKALCDSYGYDLRNLSRQELLFRSKPESAVTFVDNHDFRGGNTPEIVNDKLLAYAFILTHEGYPCIYWKDYYIYSLALSGSRNGIDALLEVHEQYANGQTLIRYSEADLYVMERSGSEGKSGLVFVLNNSDIWRGAEVCTTRASSKWTSIAWWSAHDLRQPEDKRSDAGGRVALYAPPRGFAVYVVN